MTRKKYDMITATVYKKSNIRIIMFCRCTDVLLVCQLLVPGHVHLQYQVEGAQS